MVKILITGTSGFIGRKLADRCKRKNLVLGYCRNPSGIKGIDEINDDLLNIARHQKELKEVKYVYHLAGLINFHKNSLKESLKVNVLGTRKILETCRKIGIKKFLFVSSGARLGFAENNNDTVDEESNYIPPKTNPYAYSKYLAEKEVLKYSQYFNVVIVNPSTVYGDGDKKGNSSFLIKLVATGKLRFFFPGGSSYIDIDDLIEGMTLAMEKGKNNYILSAENLTYKKLICRIAQTLNKKGVEFCFPGLTFMPAMIILKTTERLLPRMRFINSNILEGFYKYRYFNITKAKSELGFKPKYKIEDSVKKVIKEWKKQIKK